MIPAARRPVFRCLNVRPTARPTAQSRNTSRYVNIKATKPKGPQLPEEDFVSVHRAEALRRAAHLRKRNWLALGAALSMMAPIFLVRMWDVPLEKEKDPDTTTHTETQHNIADMLMGPPTKADAPRKAAEEFQGKKIVIAAGDKVIAAPASSDNPQATDPDAVELVETGSSYVPYFPRTITLPTQSTTPSTSPTEEEYQLLGLGIRKVSFLRVQVYVVGLYVKTSDLSILQNHLINTVNPAASALIPGEKEDLRTALLDPQKSQHIWEAILSQRGPHAVNMAFRIVPCRGTDFKHLQDGWMRGIASRTDEVRRKQADLLRQQAVENKTIRLPQPVDEGEFADEAFGLAMKAFKGLFQGRGKAPKGSVIVLMRDGEGVLGALYQPLTKTDKLAQSAFLGSVKDERVSKLVWLMYLAGENVSSEPARRSVVEGCVGIVERPVGTVEGRVL
ncbi:hypothetical protein P153DRAFT_299506 [Dothidotthia symphoricarpi CBS 119687]|uniref:Chalcone isomerase domain-containing protein n=1 Tax=Dothidotthia symphoricarpi CBS 119687 TaxID=1392245 RepID=A0A6A6A0Z0_9PLEO|nr:uncharacterized protein P153DRAFT_299506 [Dothidotthia symphoricarpi CBS 119687]KAF2125672.1 hypothetical protein P153DRAFT_299506 [Dothidotthia symphoricarpi CBS 119687]